ncbi:MAG TPA: hypothetical protein VHS34_09035 [Terriglobales bacterium]|jgi:hypothetical protein|nr:hypothetical protein [Terriglobales bacterium]
MPTIKRTLSLAETLANIARARKMIACGVDLQIPEEWEERARPLDIMVDGDFPATAFDLDSGTAAYAVWVRLVARRRVMLMDCRLATSCDDDIRLTGNFDNGEPTWWLGHQDFPRRQVLNPRIENHLKFYGYGHTMEGVILATGSKGIPESWHHGTTAPITISFLDQNRDEISQSADLFVDRTWARKRISVRRNGLRSLEEIPKERDRLGSEIQPCPAVASLRRE